MPLGPGQSLVDPSTGRIISQIPDRPERPQGPVSLSPGARLIEPSTGRLIASAPTAPPAPQNERIVQVMGPNGTPIWVRESDAVNKPAANVPRQPTGADRSATGFFNRMLEAERNARQVEDTLSGQDLGAQQYAPGWLQNWLQTDEGQRYQQAQRMFTEARLRKESGAAIPESEFENDRRMNFRIAGDKPESIKQKRAARLQTMRSIANAAGRGLQEYYGEGANVDDLLKEFGETDDGEHPPLDKFGATYIWDGSKYVRQ